MTELTATRTLVKSHPELWAECSDAASLARHLGQFGEIRITRLEPETAVAWEGEHASGTVRLEPSGWGTRVVLTAQPLAESVESEGAGPAEPAAPAEPAPPDEPEVLVAPTPRRPGPFGRLMRWLKGPAAQPSGAVSAEPVQEEPAPAQATVASAAEDTETPPAAALEEALESLGQAHRRPFSRP